MKRVGVALLLCVLWRPAVVVGATTEPKRPYKLAKKGKKGNPFDRLTTDRFRGYLKKVVEDSYDIGHNFISFTSLKIATGVMPFYLIGRRADAVVHRQFYDVENHLNKNQPPKFLCNLALDDRYLAIPFVTLGLIGWLHHEPYKRRRGQIFMTGLGWAFAVKNSLKLIKTDANLRPWHENFDRHQRSHGGNPSGHMTITSYMATFWALEKGKTVGIPLGLFTAFAVSMNVACNHHYLSQAIAGTGLGIMLGVASHRAFKNLTIPQNMSIAPIADDKGRPGIRLVYDF